MSINRRPRAVPTKGKPREIQKNNSEKKRMWGKIIPTITLLASITGVVGYTLKDVIQTKESAPIEQPAEQKPQTVARDTSIQQKVRRSKDNDRVKKFNLPRVLLLYTRGQLNLHNIGKNDLYVWGDKFGDTAPIIEKEPRTILTGTYYYFLTNTLEISSGEALIPFEVYLSDISGHKFIAKFDLLIIGEGKDFEIHVQQKGISKGEW